MVIKTAENQETQNSVDINNNFSDLHTPLNLQQAIAESDRCLYCFDAPCIQACPTSIDIPTFIHQIRTGNTMGSAMTILSQNIMGGTCARACPTEVLCEQACVLNTSIDQPVEIGLLQRHAVDHLLNTTKTHPFERKDNSGKKVAIIGAGPAGLSCAHRLAMLGHDSDVFEAKDKAGGLNEYGLAAYKMVNNFAQKEIEFLIDIGGINIHYNKKLGKDIQIKQLLESYDAIFIGIGLTNVYQLDIVNEGLMGVEDAVDFIEEIRQAEDKKRIKVGNDVIIIGAGNTAIDAAIQSKRLGAENVTLVYRRGEQHMSATPYEIDLARKNGVNIKLWSAPTEIIGDEHVCSIRFNKTTIEGGQFTVTDQHYELDADLILKAIGQKLQPSGLENIPIEKGKIVVNNQYHTSIKGVFAGGDAIASGEDLTVQAVEDGKQAAHAIDQFMTQEDS